MLQNQADMLRFDFELKKCDKMHDILSIAKTFT